MSSLLVSSLSVLLVVHSVLTISSRSPVVAMVQLIAAFVMAGAYLAAQGLGFLGLAYLIVYVGAVTVLFLFVVMLLNVRNSEIASQRREYWAGLPLGVLVGTLFLFELLSVLPAASHQLTSLALTAFNGINSLLLGASASVAPNAVHLAYSGVTPDGALGLSNQVHALGTSLYLHGSLWLLVAGLILLLAMMGPISLCAPRYVSSLQVRGGPIAKQG